MTYRTFAVLLGLQRFKIPAGQKTRIMFRPWIKRQSNAKNPQGTSQSLTSPVALSSTLEWHELKMDISDPKEFRCLECRSKFNLADHFKYVFIVPALHRS